MKSRHLNCFNTVIIELEQSFVHECRKGTQLNDREEWQNYDFQATIK